MEAAIWESDGSVRRLPSAPNKTQSIAYDINDAGYVVGYAGAVTYWDTAPTVWAPDGSPIQLDVLPGYSAGVAYGINSNGTIVGYCESMTGTCRAVVWEPVPEPLSVTALLFGLCGIALRRGKK